jgi:hypothetical protein
MDEILLLPIQTRQEGIGSKVDIIVVMDNGQYIVVELFLQERRRQHVLWFTRMQAQTCSSSLLRLPLLILLLHFLELFRQVSQLAVVIPQDPVCALQNVLW